MKKILLSLLLIGAVLLTRAQTVLNEVYVDPGSGKSEFFELYNSGVGVQSADCFTVLAYFENSSSDRGWYVLDLPTLVIAPKGFFVGAAATPFNTQSTTGSVANFSWNDAAFRSGATGGSFTKYTLNAAGNGYVASAPAANINDIFTNSKLAGPTYLVLVYVDGAFSNGFFGGGASGALPTSITSLPSLPIDMNGSCSDFSATFSAIGAIEFVNAAPGTDNGYARTSDGKCGAWDKTSSSVNHTPGVTNNTAGSVTATGSLTTAQFINCASETIQAFVTFDITQITGAVTLADDFPVEVQVYNDINRNGALDGTDLYIRSKFMPSVVAPSDTVRYSPSNADLIVVYKTKRGCFDKIVPLVTECIALPVKLKSFTAKRFDDSNVAISWTTGSEQNSKGFNVQKNMSGEWKTIAFVPSQAQGGNSSFDLFYSFKDVNREKGITQYRIQQVDLDGTTKYSDIRAVRGENTLSKVVVYPNPSVDGKINVVFEDNTALRDVYVNDMQGRVIRSYRNISNNILVIEKLTSGFYTIKVTNRNTAASSVEKVVVK